jgi:hypothetical protein
MAKRRWRGCLNMPTDEFLERVTHDLQLSNTHIAVDEIKSFIARCNVWRYEWGVILANENDMHIHVLTDYRKKVFLRKPIIFSINESFKKYKVLKTSVLKIRGNNLLNHYLKMGWKLKNETDKDWLLEMTKKDFKYEPN